MTTRGKRLKKLVEVQGKLKALHEARHAGHLADARRAEDEAQALAGRFQAEDSLSGLFPELYHRRIADAVDRGRRRREDAAAEADRLALASARTTVVERAYREAAASEERAAEDRERLEAVARRRPGGDGAT
ncbi:hypothetical protein N1F89_13615 [Aquibium sp. A9E412]|uniref:hypothetical protein n=1 Tax=Aquibium sp. A9E412 TaxID=2976767 RepID=UPI0025AF1317|nr:hypothetical protein [Aquibium sp. A9E412]MDN2567261.1 hypothetical protein [Aquibium sp. A9E412]